MTGPLTLSALLATAVSIVVHVVPPTVDFGFVFQAAGYGAVLGLLASMIRGALDRDKRRNTAAARKREETFARWGTALGFLGGLVFYIVLLIVTKA